MIELIEAPFQIIHVGAAAPTIPEPLIDQVSCSALQRVLELIVAGKTRKDVHTGRRRYSRSLLRFTKRDQVDK